MEALKPVEVRDGHGAVEPGHDRDRPKGVVRTDPDVVRLGERGDAFQLRDTTGPGDVRHDEVNQAFLKQGDVVVAREVALAHADRDVRAFPHLPERPEALGRDRLLVPDQVDVLQRPSGGYRRRHVEPPVGVDHQLRVRTDGLSHGVHPVNRLRDGARRQILHPAGPGVGPGKRPLPLERVCLDGVVAVGERLFCRGDSIVDGHALVPLVLDVGVERDAVPDRAADQPVDRLAKHLAADVPQRDVDATDQVRYEATAAE